MPQELTVDAVRALLRYDEGTGSMTWASNGRRAGYLTAVGYVQVGIGGRLYLGHRLVWFYVHGEWPEIIDHIDGDKRNNRISNLRSVCRRVNAQNLRAAKASNKCGLLGVSLCKRTGRWRAQIGDAGKKIKLGRFASPQLAHEAYLRAKRRLHEGATI